MTKNSPKIHLFYTPQSKPVLSWSFKKQGLGERTRPLLSFCSSAMSLEPNSSVEPDKIKRVLQDEMVKWSNNKNRSDSFKKNTRTYSNNKSISSGLEANDTFIHGRTPQLPSPSLNVSKHISDGQMLGFEYGQQELYSPRKDEIQEDAYNSKKIELPRGRPSFDVYNPTGKKVQILRCSDLTKSFRFPNIAPCFPDHNPIEMMEQGQLFTIHTPKGVF